MRRRPGSFLMSSLYGSAGDQKGMNSPGAPPRALSTKAAVSRTVRLWQPWIDTRPDRSDRPGASENTPRDTFRPMLPFTPAGMRMEPPPSVACDSGSTPAATTAAVPADEPQVVYSRSHGLRVTLMEFSAELHTPNSGVVLRPTMLRPALRSCCVRKLSAAGRWPCIIMEPNSCSRPLRVGPRAFMR